MTPENMTSTMWMHMLNTGGRWTASEMAHFCKGNRDRADKLLSSMALNGYAKSYRSPTRKNGRSYGVDLTCNIPRWLNLRDVLTAAGRQIDHLELEDEADLPVPSRRGKRGALTQFARATSIFSVGDDNNRRAA